MILLASLLLAAAVPHPAATVAKHAAAAAASDSEYGDAPEIEATAQIGNEDEWDGNPRDNASDFEDRIVALHNHERARLAMPGLRWNDELAAGAQAWANELARRHTMVHSADWQRPEQGENLFTGTAGAYSLEDMVGDLIDEKADFHPGIFPAVANDGNWHNVGHYTQIIWRGTREIGCALASGRGDDFLVCRYYPAGNVIGQRVPQDGSFASANRASREPFERRRERTAQAAN